MKNLIDLPNLTVAEIGLIISVTAPITIYLLGRLLDKRRLAADANKAEEEAKRVVIDGEQAKSAIRKLEAEIAEKYISSAGELVGEYKTMLDNLNKEFIVIKEKLKATDERLDAEIENRRALERVTIEIYSGVKKLMDQVITAQMTPSWELGAHIEAELEKLKQRHQQFGAD